MQIEVRKLKQEDVPNHESDDDKEDRNVIGNGKSVVNVTKATALLQMRRRQNLSNYWFYCNAKTDTKLYSRGCVCLQAKASLGKFTFR